MIVQAGTEENRRQRAIARQDVASMTRFVEGLVESAFGIAHSALHAPGRGAAKIAFARQVAMYLCCVRLGHSCSAAGRFFGRDRTTAAHACRVIEERRENSSVDSLIDCLERAIDMRRQADAAWSDGA